MVCFSRRIIFALLFQIICGCADQHESSSTLPIDGLSSQTPPEENEPIQPGLPVSQMPAVYRDYGPLYATAVKLERELETKPWSAWWFPLRDRRLFSSVDGTLSPLQKYDEYARRTHGDRPMAADYEEKELYSPEAAAWEGLCHAWALASLLHPEPKKSISLGGVEFSVNDQKALLIKSYEQYDARYYGQRYVDPASSDWNSIAPHLFHRFVVGELVERGRPFVMNKMPGVEVWNVPVWKVHTQLERDAMSPKVYHARTVLVGASVLDNPSDVTGTISDFNLYTYDLYTEKDAQGRDFVISGRWTGVSESMHPSILIVLPTGPFVHQSRNPHIRTDRVEGILRPSSP